MGARQAFTVKEVLDKGWAVTQKYWVKYLITMLCIALVSGLITAVGGALGAGKGNLISFLFFVINLAWQGIAVIAIVRLALAGVDGKAISLKELFSAGWMEVAYMVAILVLLSLVVGIGFALLIVPGIIALLMFGFAPYVAVEKKLTPIDAMKASMALTEGNRNNMFMYGLSLIGLAIGLGIVFMILMTLVGALVKVSMILGVILLIPLAIAGVVAYFAFAMVCVFGWAYIYRKLTAMRPMAMNA